MSQICLKAKSIYMKFIHLSVVTKYIKSVFPTLWPGYIFLIDGKSHHYCCICPWCEVGQGMCVPQCTCGGQKKPLGGISWSLFFLSPLCGFWGSIRLSGLVWQVLYLWYHITGSSKIFLSVHAFGGGHNCQRQLWRVCFLLPSGHWTQVLKAFKSNDFTCWAILLALHLIIQMHVVQ